MKILITGARGMVGQNIAHHELFKKYQLLLPSRDQLNLFHYADVEAYLKLHKPDLIIHCAGRVGGIQANINNPYLFLTENIELNKNLLQAAEKSRVPKLINLGSSCMYPRNHDDQLTEEMILTGELEPTNEGYALAKIMAQKMCDYIRIEKQLEYKTLIPCNLYGPYDKFDLTQSHLIPAIILKLNQALQSGSSIVEIWGDGSARREFMYIEDLVECLDLAIQNYESLPSTVNVGLGFDYSILDYYKTAAQVIGYRGDFTFNLTKPVGMKRKLVSVKKINSWGWKSRFALDEGIQKTFNYFKTLK